MPCSTKPEKLARTIRRRIVARRQPGERLPSMAELARRFGISLNTIMAALAILDREGMVERRHGSGTYVTDGARRQPVALVVGIDPRYPQVTYFPIRTMQVLSGFLRGQGYRTRPYWVTFAPDQPRLDPSYLDLIEDVREHRLCGAAAVRGFPDTQWTEAAQAVGIPFVNGTDGRYQIGVPGVSGMVKTGVRRLLEKGCRRIALMGWFGSGKVASEARAVLAAVLKEQGLAMRQRWFQGELHPAWAGAGYEEFKEIWTAEKEKPDGLLVCDDILCADVAVAILENGIRVPDQMLVATHTTRGSGIVYPFPTIQLEYDPDAHARAMGEMLVRLIRKEPVPEPRVMLPIRVVDGLGRNPPAQARPALQPQLAGSQS